MSSRDDILDGAVRQLREASNPSAEQRTRIRAALQGLGTSPSPPAPEHAPRADRPATPGASPPGVSPRSLLRGPLLLWGFAVALASFGIGVGVGFGLERGGSVAPPPEPDAMPVQAAQATPAPPLDAPEPRRAPALLAPAAPPPAPERQALQPQPKPRPPPPPRARPSAARVEQAPRGPLSLAEALELLRRAERAIYSDNAAWALSLLDELDEQAPRALLHEERIATRILAWCADGQVENAERLASQARREAPDSIYGGILERACDSARVPTPNSPRP